LWAAAHELTLGSLAPMAPREASWGDGVLGKPEQLGHVLARRHGCLVLRNRLDVEPGHHGVSGGALCGGRLADLRDDLGKGARALKPLGPAVQRLAQRLPIGCTAWERLAVLAGGGAALIARRRGFEWAIGAQKLAFDAAKVGEKVHHDVGDLVDHRVTDAVANVAPIVFPWHLVVQAGELPGATARVAVVQIATPLGVIVVWLHRGGHFEHDEAGRVRAASTSSAIVRCTQGAGAADVQGGTDEPAETAVDSALRGARKRMGDACIVREPSTWRFGTQGGAGLAMVLVATRSMGDQGVESTGRALLGGGKAIAWVGSSQFLLKEGCESGLL
jgi:hypothetical protein